MKKQRVALMGEKVMGKGLSNVWRKVGNFFERPLEPVMKVICGRDAEAVKRAGDKFGWEECSTSWEDVVSRNDIDIVDVCTPGDTHMPIVVAAAAAMKTILCEKPLANTVDEAERMLVAARANGIIHMVCHNYRRVPAVVLARQLIEEGRIGEIHHYRGTYLQDWLVNPGLPRLWRCHKSKPGSGALRHSPSPSVHLLRYL